MDVDDLIAFEDDIADRFNRGEIRAVVHLSGGNEPTLIEIFKRIKPDDYVCGQWRMHYHCSLKGVSPALLRADILGGHSIALCYTGYRIISSGIAGGILPIANGIAAAIKDLRRSERVWVFVGDMTAEMGIYYECVKYALGHGLRITFVTEDNGLSVCTDTKKAWNDGSARQTDVLHYEYKLTRPHVGTGKWVTF